MLRLALPTPGRLRPGVGNALRAETTRLGEAIPMNAGESSSYSISVALAVEPECITRRDAAPIPQTCGNGVRPVRPRLRW
ncbi:MAG: hypothetical protein CMJ18_25820 [Phycisphaeraceae bacterium]|nr:hypothetical protein [Phycisphaeraceae bacterium]